ncbi:low molecular weight phosphatase family protein [Yimella sp. cx-573]|nr:low molecular weight phosphatase family protein [Yimella sp. cx-573]
MTDARILTVCTGNICRSPYMERVLATQLAGRGYTVASAGTRALVDYPIEPQSLQRLQQLGIDDGGFRSRQLTPEMIADADLIITATRHHRAEVVTMEPKGLKYTFALADLSDLVRDMDIVPPASGGLFGPADDSFVGRLIDDVGKRRTTIHPRGEDEADVVDPYRRAPEVFDRMAAQLNELMPPVVRALTLES